MPILAATSTDTPALVALLNSAYRGDASKKGWTTEADLLHGELRTDEAAINKLMQTPGAVFLKYVNEENKIAGCVFLHKMESKLYLGMLSVSPLLQAKGTGKQLLAAATNYAAEHQCLSIFMRVFSVRHELIAWYERHGYSKTGKTEPYTGDNRFGVPTRALVFVIMEKNI